MLAIHAFTVGGIGLMTVGMMARAALGHTGRNVFAPPAVLSWISIAMLLSAVVRALLPMALPAQYGVWVGLSQLLWIAAFGAFSWIYAPILWRTRIDGRYG